MDSLEYADIVKGWGTRNKCHIPVAEQIEDNRVKVREV